MHLRGKAFRFEAVYPDGKREVLLDVPRYEFEWQNVYVLAEPKLMPEGTVLRCLARYDNSSGQPVEPRPDANGHAGASKRSDEMLVGYVEVALADQDLALGEPTSRKLDDGRYEVTFRYRPPTGTKAVYLAGDLQRLEADRAEDGRPGRRRAASSVKQTLAAGTHEYKYVLEGTKWRHDPGNRRQAGHVPQQRHSARRGEGSLRGGGHGSRRDERPALLAASFRIAEFRSVLSVVHPRPECPDVISNPSLLACARETTCRARGCCMSRSRSRGRPRGRR